MRHFISFGGKAIYLHRRSTKSKISHRLRPVSAVPLFSQSKPPLGRWTTSSVKQAE
jgi:hypothetical protein